MSADDSGPVKLENGGKIEPYTIIIIRTTFEGARAQTDLTG
jgi:hypothetical protein